MKIGFEVLESRGANSQWLPLMSSLDRQSALVAVYLLVTTLSINRLGINQSFFIHLGLKI